MSNTASWTTLVSLLILVTQSVSAEPPRFDAHGDPLPAGALLRFGTIRFRQGDGINNSAISPDGRLLATTAHRTVAVWEIATGRRLHLLNCDVSREWSSPTVAFSPDGKLLACASEFDVGARIWDMATGKLVRTIGTKSAWFRPPMLWQPGPGSVLWFSPHGKELLLYDNWTIAVYDPQTGARLREFKVPDQPQAFTPDGK